MYPKILIGCPTYEGKEYCLNQYIQAIKSLTYPNYDILLIDNSKDNDYFEKIKKLNIPVVKDTPVQTSHDSIVQSRNILRKHLLERDYDYFLSLEQDVIPPKNIIEQLLQHNKKVITGVYYTTYLFHGIPKLRPLIWADVSKNSDKMRFMNSECIAAKNLPYPLLTKIKMCGLGCILIHRSVLEKINFRVPEDYSTYDDFAFCTDVKKIGEDVWADLTIQCEHIFQK